MKFISYLITLLAVSYAIMASGQVAPEFMVTWKANSYIPTNYPGKALPSNGSKVEVAIELIDRGKIADLSRTEVRWFINNRLQNSVIGLKNFSFIAQRLKGDHEVRIDLLNYRGVNLTKTITIPLVNPEVVIDSPYPENLLTAGLDNFFQALPYFFNIPDPSEIKFVWSANGLKTEGAVLRSDILNLNTAELPSGTNLNLEVITQNILNSLEVASKSINLRIR